MANIIMTDGTRSKSLNPWDVDDNVGWISDKDREDNSALYGRVAWAYRAVNILGLGVASVPFDLVDEKGDIVESSADWKNTKGTTEDPFKLLSLLAQSRAIAGSAYAQVLRNKSGVVKGIRYKIPTSIKPVFDKKTGELLHFERKQNTGGPIKIPVEDMIYSWYVDPTVEIGPPNNFPMTAAFSSAGALDAMNEFVRSYFARGAIKATVFTLQGNPDSDELKDMESYLTRLMGGIKNAFRIRMFNADALDPVVVGEGIDSVTNDTLTREQRENISSAFGIPQTILFSSSSGGLGGAGVVKTDRLALYRDTIVPEVKSIFSDINKTLEGLFFVEKHEEMDIFQEDENQRSTSVQNYTDAISTDPAAAAISMSILGVEMTEETQQAYAEYIKNKPVEETTQKSKTINPAEEDLKRWRKKASKSNYIGKAVKFESDTIPHSLNLSIVNELPKCKSGDDVRAVFDKAMKKNDIEEFVKILATVETEIEAMS